MSATHILVVDDEPEIRGLVQEILEDEGYRVGIAENGEAARLALRERRPDLILLDIWMPDLDGITLLKEWAEDEGLPCPVIMMSGHGTVETAVEATRLGAYDFLEKPLSMAKLLLTVERALEADKLHQENIGLKRRAPRSRSRSGAAPPCSACASRSSASPSTTPGYSSPGRRAAGARPSPAICTPRARGASGPSST